MVYPAKIGHNNWNWKGNDQDTAERADTAHNFTNHRRGNHVAIPVQSANVKAEVSVDVDVDVDVNADAH